MDAALEVLSLNVKRRDFLVLTATAAILTAIGDAPNTLDVAAETQNISPPPAPVARILPANLAAARQRAVKLVAGMTLAEKISQMGVKVPAITRLGIAENKMAFHEALHGIMHPGPTTSFPIPLALANSWNPELMLRIFTAVSDEAWASHKKDGGVLVFHSPVTVNMAEDPRWGRVQESLGEDPVLVSRLAVQTLRGMQGSDPKYLKTLPCAKHLVCNNTEHDRQSISANPDPRSLREYYLAPFLACVREAGVFSVMAAFNSLFNIPCCANPMLLIDILRNEWGFEGFVVSDQGGIENMCTGHHYVSNDVQAAAAGLNAGCDLDGGSVYQNSLQQALEQKLVSEAQIDRSLIRFMTGQFLLGTRQFLRGIFDQPDSLPFSKISVEVLDSAEHRALAQEAARQSIVLLKNQNNFLPLDTSRLKSVAVIGPTAAMCQLGGYSGAPLLQISPLAGIAAALGMSLGTLMTDQFPPPSQNNLPDFNVENNLTLYYRQGCTVSGKKDPVLFDTAIDAAKNADVVILVAGVDMTVDKEQLDRADITLTGVQHELIQAVHQVNPRIVLVLNSNAPVAVNWEQENISAIVAALCAGQAQGTAIADVLFGNSNPCGKLASTWYRGVSDLPDFHDYDLTKGRTYMYFAGEPLYPFGHGLSFTRFEFSDLKINGGVIKPGTAVNISATITNTGSRWGGRGGATLFGSAPGRSAAADYAAGEFPARRTESRPQRRGTIASHL
jgi:beta-glucosidase